MDALLSGAATITTTQADRILVATKLRAYVLSLVVQPARPVIHCPIGGAYRGWYGTQRGLHGQYCAHHRFLHIDGVIVADGGRFGGWCIYVRGNRMHYTTNNFGERSRVSSDVAIPPGITTLRADVVRVGKDEGRVRFYVDEQPAGQGVLSPFRAGYFVNEPFDVGRDSQTPVDDIYDSPYLFCGSIIDVTIEVAGREVVDQDVLLDQLMGSQ